MFKIETVGADPEFFVHTGSIFFPSIPFTSGNKIVPEYIGNNCYLQRDNLMLEGNIPPAKTYKEFETSLNFLKDFAKSRVAMKNMNIVCEDSAEFKPRFLRLPEAHEFGCTPYSLAWIPKTIGSKEMFGFGKLRSRPAGFHIHIGGNFLDQKRKRLFVRLFDLFITNPARYHNFDEVRVKNYGTFGAFRYTPYGVECRSLGSHFLNDDHLPWIWDQLMKIEDHMNNFLLKSIHMDYSPKWTTISNREFISKETYELFNIDLSNQLKYLPLESKEYAYI